MGKQYFWLPLRIMQNDLFKDNFEAYWRIVVLYINRKRKKLCNGRKLQSFWNQCPKNFSAFTKRDLPDIFLVILKNLIRID